MGKKSDRTKLKEKLLERDNALCGFHSGGCGERIEIVEEANIDHIIPKSFFEFLPNAKEFNPRSRIHLPTWNLQPMHPTCNNSRGGQLINGVQFRCRCHHNFIDSNGERHVCYLEGGTEDLNLDNDNMRWEKYFYSGEEILGDKSPVGNKIFIEDNPVRFKIHGKDHSDGRDIEYDGIIIPKKDRLNSVGFEMGGRGHIIWDPGPFDRIQSNMQEMFRCHRWRCVFAEGESFMKMLNEMGREHLHKEYRDDDLYVVGNVLFMMDVSNKFIREGFRSGSAAILNNAFGKRWMYIPREFIDMRLHNNPEEWGKVLKIVEYELVKYMRYISRSFKPSDESDRDRFLTHLTKLEKDFESKYLPTPPPQDEPTPNRAERRRQERRGKKGR